MHQSLLQQKAFQKGELQRQCRHIEEALREVIPHYHVTHLSMKNDVELQVRSQQVYEMALAEIKRIEPYGITQAKLVHFYTLIIGFSVLLEDIEKKTSELYGKTAM